MIHIAVIGYGYWGPNLVRNFQETAGLQVAAVADLDPQRLALAARRSPGVRVTADARELLHDPAIDAIAVATPVHTHFDLGMAALAAGKHLWIEKPMTQTSSQAALLAAEAERRGLTLIVDHTFLYTGAVQKMAALMHAGELGQTYYYDSIRVNLGLFQRDVSVISDLAVHDFAILDHLLGEHPCAVTASGTNHFPGSPENLAYVTLFYDSGTIAHVNVSWLSPVKLRQILVGGSKKMIAYDDLEPSEKVKVYDKGVSFTDDPAQIHALRVGYRSGDVIAPQIALTEALLTESRHFVDCIAQRAQPLTGARLGQRVVELIEAAHASMRLRGQTVSLQPQRNAA